MNPYYSYAISFSIALAVYFLNWSSLYPKMSAALGSFLLLTVLAHFFFGSQWKKRAAGWPKVNLREDRNVILVTIFIYCLWTADFIYEGGIPLFKILFGVLYNYRMFGVPSLHVFTVTFASFYTVYLFHVYLSTRKKIVLILYFINLSAAILIYSRAMFVFNVASSLFIYLFSVTSIRFRTYVIAAASILVFIFLFGVMGTLRVSRESRKINYNNQLFLKTGQATDSFRDSWIPNEFFWTYIYVSSPLANLQKNILVSEKPTVSPISAIELINSELLFDFISKRTIRWFHLTDVRDSRIPGPFNVATLYSRSYNYLGWAGMVIMALAALLLPWVYLKVLPAQSPFFLSGVAILCTMYLFMSYDNTIRFTGLGFQLVYPVIFTWLERRQFFKLIKHYT